MRSGESGIEEWLANVRSALETNDDMQLMDQFRMDLAEDEVFVFTPKGDLFKLPAGATVLDFAYAIHSKVGNQCTGARIAGRNVSIRQKLQSGDQVEILTSANQTPKQDWLGVVATSKARAKIRQSLKEMQAGQALLAKEELERKLKNRKLDYDEPALMHTITRLGYRVVTEFYAALSDGTLDMAEVIEAYATQLRHDRGEEEKTAPAPTASQYVMQTAADVQQRASDDVLVIDQNLKGLDFQMARCCQPVYGPHRPRTLGRQARHAVPHHPSCGGQRQPGRGEQHHQHHQQGRKDSAAQHQHRQPRRPLQRHAHRHARGHQPPAAAHQETKNCERNKECIQNVNSAICSCVAP